MNEAESAQIATWYTAQGWRLVKDWHRADEVIINSCSIRETAENRVFGLINNIFQFARRQKKSPPKVILTGCMVGSALGDRHRYTLRQFKLRLPPEVELRSRSFWEAKKLFPQPQKNQPFLLSIMEGCNHFCTYCVVPYARGEEVSFPFETLVCQAQEIAVRGGTHLVLLGQNVNSYGKDFSPAEKSRLFKKSHESIHETFVSPKANLFALLLKTIHSIPEIKKISFLTSNPWDLSDEIIETMKLPKVDRYFHLAVQSGDDEILRRMNRGYTATEFLVLVKKLKKAVPEIELGTDIIVGFPGETEAAFQNTVKLCRQAKFVKGYISLYSPRPGTAAFRLTDDIPHAEKRRRWLILNDLINPAR